jgi:hypothetical protein
LAVFDTDFTWQESEDHAESGAILGSAASLLNLQLVVDLGHARSCPSSVDGILDGLPRRWVSGECHLTP